MTDKNKKTSASFAQAGLNPKTLFWVGLAIVLVLAVAAVTVWRPASSPFSLTKGEVNVMVVLRNTRTAEYTLTYEGKQPVTLERVLPMLQGQTLHMDVKEMEVEAGAQVYPVDNTGGLVAEAPLVLGKGDSFRVRITFLGQSLGVNVLYGFRLGYQEGGQSTTFDLILKDQYTVFVE